jgi:hypothetical protein
VTRRHLRLVVSEQCDVGWRDGVGPHLETLTVRSIERARAVGFWSEGVGDSGDCL